jgi:transcriptional regulator with XRE-family HTH domain
MYTAGIPAVRVGSLLAQARTAGGIAEHDLASTLRVRLRVIRQWERGELVPTDDQIEAIAATCGIRLTELLPRRATLVYDSATGVMRLGDQAVALPTTSRDDDAVLGAFLGLVRLQRGLRADQDVSVREEDLEALSEALDLDDEELEERFVRILGLSRRQAALVRAQLVRRRLTAGMVGLVAGLSLIAVNRVFTTATENVRTVGGGRTTRSDLFLSTTTTTTSPTAPVVVVTTPVVLAEASSTLPISTTAAVDPGTLPAIVLAEQFVAPTEPNDVRTGPVRTASRSEASRHGDPSNDTSPTTTIEDTSPPTTLPNTTNSTEPSSSTPPTTTETTAPTRPASTPPETTPSTTPTSGPVVSTVGGGGTTGTTEPPVTTTTTEPPGTTTTTEPPVTTTTTSPPVTTTTTTSPPVTTTTTTAPPFGLVGAPNVLGGSGG